MILDWAFQEYCNRPINWYLVIICIRKVILLKFNKNLLPLSANLELEYLSKYFIDDTKRLWSNILSVDLQIA